MILDKLKATNSCILVPTYNNGSVLAGVLDDLKPYSQRVIVVNDGSTDNTTAVLTHYRDMDIIGYVKNRGKGFALKTGFRHALELGFEHVITIDSDGQHRASDLGVFLDEIAKKPGALLVGSRNLEAENMPGKNTFANRFSNFWFHLETGKKMPDTQSGYRLYPVRPMAFMKTFTSRYEFELEILVRAAWKGIELKPVPISVYYPPAGERISHFRPFRDFFRISVLNTCLVLAALLYYRPLMMIRDFSWANLKTYITQKVVKPEESNGKKATAIGFGIFMGIFPVWGYQMILAVVFAHLFKLNKAVVLIASNISIGPMIPVMVYFSFLFGGLFVENPNQLIFNWDEITLDTVGDYLLQYLVGSILLAISAGLTIGLISYLTLSIFRKKRYVH